jgi:predicted NUDIX family NTP pyrophosphohydrolase
MAASAQKISAGLLLFRRRGSDLQVLLGHPGGPYWANKDDGAWSIPKGGVADGEDLLAAARREFEEETGHKPDGTFVLLGEARQPGGKLVVVYAVEGDWDPSTLRSNIFSMLPRKSGRMGEFPELDQAHWFSIEEAERKILKGQFVFLSMLGKAVQVRNQGS